MKENKFKATNLNNEENIHNTVMDYFIDLDNLKLKRKKGAILGDAEDIYYSPTAEGYRYNINGVTDIYVKHEDIKHALFGMSSSKMYKDLGIPTPITTGFYKNEDLAILRTASQDVVGLKNRNIDISIADRIFAYSEFANVLGLGNDGGKPKEKWNVFKNPICKAKLLTFMTPECLEKFMTVLLLDELRGDPDRHWSNFFLYRNPGSKRWEGIIPIDLELSVLINISYGFTNKTQMKEILNYYYDTFNAFEKSDKRKNYHERIDAIKKLIHKDKLSDFQLHTLKKALEYDFPGSILRKGKKFCFQKDGEIVHDVYDCVWNFARDNLKSELEL